MPSYNIRKAGWIICWQLRADLVSPPEGIEAILPYARPRRLDAGEILFRAGDQGTALQFSKAAATNCSINGFYFAFIK
jgi:hypothetical protein